jgi:hypothetical protein
MTTSTRRCGTDSTRNVARCDSGLVRRCVGRSAVPGATASAAATAVDGLVLINPWVRSAGSLAQTQLRHYYGARLAQSDFWRKVVRGQFDVVGSLRSLASNARTAFGRTTPSKTTSPYQDEMADSLRRFGNPILLVTSGNDLTAREFLDYAAADPNWRGLLQRPTLTHYTNWRTLITRFRCSRLRRHSRRSSLTGWRHWASPRRAEKQAYPSLRGPM